MLCRIPNVDYEKCYPTRLKKIFRADLNYRNYNSFIPNMENAIVGNIPKEIIDLFLASNKGTKIKAFQNALANITIHLRKTYKNAKEQNFILNDFKDLQEDLPDFEASISEFAAKLFKNILPDGYRPKLNYVARGAWGNVFQLSIRDANGKKIMHDKALKVYHNLSTPNMWYLEHIQNNCAEANFWTYLKFAVGHKLDKTQFTKHYISDLKSGYALTEFIDKDITRTSSPIDLTNLFRIFYIDVSNELINDKLYDVGGFVKQPDFIDDKVVLRYFKKLWFRNSEKELNKVIQNYETKIANPKTPHRVKIKKALELFKHKKDINNNVV